jgi:hypothetical protein
VRVGYEIVWPHAKPFSELFLGDPQILAQLNVKGDLLLAELYMALLHNYSPHGMLCIIGGAWLFEEVMRLRLLGY